MKKSFINNRVFGEKKDCEPIVVTKEVYYAIKNTIGGRPAESGGLLGSTDGGRTIDLFAFDYTAKTENTVYIPDTKMLNPTLAEWDSYGYQPVGIVHSHPEGCTYPSNPDMKSADVYIKAVPSFGGKMEMPIIQVGKGKNDFRIYWYTVTPTVHGLPKLTKRKVMLENKVISAPFTRGDNVNTTIIVPEKALFQRVSQVFPLEAAKKKTIVAVQLE